MMSLVRAQLGEPRRFVEQSTDLFPYNNKLGVIRMAYMTDNEFQNLMDEVLRIVKESESKDEAVEKLQGLIENKNSIF
jgi:hypothetical protein